jgi:hypothetical protein
MTTTIKPKDIRVEDIELRIRGLLKEIEGIRTHRIEEYFEENPILEILKMLEDRVRTEISEINTSVNKLKEIEIALKSKGLHTIRLPCPHPGETTYAEEVLGARSSTEVFKSRTGFNSYVVCLDCLHQFEADFRDEKVNEWRFAYERPSLKEALRGRPKMKDERKCPRCGSRNVKTVFEMIGEKCPKCKTGVIEEIETRIMT